jgi:hypothetical protein
LSRRIAQLGTRGAVKDRDTSDEKLLTQQFAAEAHFILRDETRLVAGTVSHARELLREGTFSLAAMESWLVEKAGVVGNKEGAHPVTSHVVTSATAIELWLGDAERLRIASQGDVMHSYTVLRATPDQFLVMGNVFARVMREFGEPLDITMHGGASFLELKKRLPHGAKLRFKLHTDTQMGSKNAWILGSYHASSDTTRVAFSEMVERIEERTA